MKTPRSLFPVLVGGLVLAAAAGCGQDAAKLTPVRGRVFFQDRPLRAGTVVFTPDADRGGRGPLARAEVQADGSYQLKTGDDAGAVAGWHRVTVLAVDPDVPGGRLPDWFPRRYGDPNQSGLVREVKAGEDNVIDLRLE